VRVDESGIVTYASPSIRTYGYEPSDIIGTSGLQLIHPDDREHFEANSVALLAGEMSATADRPAPVRDGGRRHPVDRGQSDAGLTGRTASRPGSSTCSAT
jgi:PAS domain S-box-containing protein